MRRRYRSDDLRRLAERPARGPAGRRPHHRPDRRLPRRDRGGLPGDPRARPRGRLRRQLLLQVLAPPGHRRRRARPTGWSRERAQERLERLQELQRGLTLAAHRARVGTTTEILVEGPSRRGGSAAPGARPLPPARPRRRRGARRGRGSGRPWARSFAVEILEATPHSLLGRPLLEQATGDPYRDSEGSRPSGR